MTIRVVEGEFGVKELCVLDTCYLPTVGDVLVLKGVKGSWKVIKRVFIYTLGEIYIHVKDYV